jgi:hypothetical protein
MSKQEQDGGNAEDSITYVYLPYEDVYGTVKSHGAWVSLIEYFEGGVQYLVEMPNDEFNVVDEIGIGYIDETEGL